ncbi:MAG: ribonuclease H-like domain-containing protein [Firmicutes bacterium]|nr:ribonuclease H-like domain-containing protein [Bacillota bacterium]
MTTPGPDVLGWRGLDAFVRRGEVWEGEHLLATLGPTAPPSPWPQALAWPEGAEGEVMALDVETTGLGGAGSAVFQVGLAWREGERVRVRQLLAPDLPAEGPLLERLAALWSERRIRLVTYNGESFDLPFLRARARFHGVRLPLPPAMDLLSHTRRLYRDRDGSCRLTHLEATRLGHPRGDDLPGSLVPQVYYESLRRGDPTLLEPVLRHNAADLVATLGLVWRVAHDLAAPPDPSRHPADLFGLYRTALAAGDAHSARRALEACLAAGPPPHLRRLALSRLSRLLRAAGDADARHVLWQAAAHAPDAPPEHLEAWAKILEHERRDPLAARAVAAAALARLRAEARALGTAPDPAREQALRRRLDRLERRLARRSPAAPA